MAKFQITIDGRADSQFVEASDMRLSEDWAELLAADKSVVAAMPRTSVSLITRLPATAKKAAPARRKK